jgi:hypothetical protein
VLLWKDREMANTSDLQAAIDWTRSELGRLRGQPFSKKTVRLSSGASHTFNAVSSDNSVVATISNASGLTSGGKRPVGKIRGAVADLYWLSLVDAPTRQLILTNGQFFEIFRQEMDGALAPGVNIMHIPLPDDLATRVAAVTTAASHEMTPE